MSRIGDKDLAKVLDKVAKLFALAGSTTSVEEAACAAAQAEAIIAKYRLQAVDVDWVDYASAPHDGSVARADEPLWSGRRSQLWVEELAKFLCEHYGCYAYVNSEDRTTQYVIVGRPSDVELCRYMFGWLSAEITRLSAPERGAKARSSFCSGAVAAVSRTMRRAARAEARAEGAAGAAIVLASRAEEAQRFARQAEPGMKVRYTRAREDAAARARGYEAGKRVHVGPTLSE
jgi:Asp-tRNA(Asn)/Glu-tRNA(Gln) amidotransferase C subunit